MTFRITETPIDTAAARISLCQPQSGGYVSFEGWVRDHHAGKAVARLNYSAYVPMAEREGARIMEEAKAQYDIDAAACIHRIGELQIGELAVWVGVAAGHRGAAFAACRHIIDRIKESVPIWKDEYYQDGSRAWTVNTPKISANGMNYACFAKDLSVGMEYDLFYKEQQYWISQRTDLHEYYFTISEDNYFVFHTAAELISAKVIDGKTLYEIWEDLWITG